jgi:SPASM domain peptide maturase of grasp-with-spasm system
MKVRTLSIEHDTPFMIYTDCIPVRGKERSIICDLTRQDYILIPNSLFEIIENHEGKTINKIKKIYKNKYNSIIDEYFNHLFQKEMVFFTDSPEQFPKIDINKWDEPHKILQCIMDFNSEKWNPTDKIIQDLNSLGCRFLQLRFFGKVSFLFLKDITDHFVNSTIESIEIMLEYDEKRTLSDYDEICKSNLRISVITVTNSPMNKQVGVSGTNNFANIIHVQTKITSHFNCGNIHSNYFSINIKTFTEGQRHNSCLNRKISIDVNGEIKNCPSMTESFGNIRETTLMAALKRKGFKRYWKLSKDKINICKDCEFRYICTDCRAYREDTNDALSKPLKCGYDPYTNKWEDWRTIPFKQRALDYYSFKEVLHTSEK